MLDPRFIVDHPNLFDAAMSKRGGEHRAEAVITLDAAWRAEQARAQDLQTRRNQLSKSIGQARAKGEDSTAIQAEVTELKAALQECEDAARARRAKLDALLAQLPNMPADDVPEGADEAHNVEVRSWGEPAQFDFAPLAHDELGARLGMDFAAAAKLSGARFVALRGQLARLERALGQFMLDVQTGAHGYTETAVPYLVRDEAMFGTGQLPKFAEDSFRTDTGHWLIPTSEVSLTNLSAGEIVDDTALPLRLTALTPCFRSEAGSAGRDTKGMIRQHQFHKCELVSITAPEQSDEEHERMTGCAEAILQQLGLPYRVMLLCTGDMGFAARRTYDLEVWLPGQGTYREISSCSTCGDFQARRMNARCRTRGEKKTRFVHTLNGSGLAVGRTLVAVLENHQQADGSVLIPDALAPYMAGLNRLEPHDHQHAV